jgi:hypothetical protein
MQVAKVIGTNRWNNPRIVASTFHGIQGIFSIFLPHEELSTWASTHVQYCILENTSFSPAPFLSPPAKVPEQRPAGWYEFQILLDAYLPQQLCSGCLGMVCYSLSGVLSKSRSLLSNFVPGTVLRKKYISLSMLALLHGSE